VIEALITTGRLTEQEAIRSTLVDHAISEVPVEWAKRWLK
jgi:hypothetical protein